MAININTTFVISVKHKQKMYLALEKGLDNRWKFFNTTVVEFDDMATLVELKRTIRTYINNKIVHLLCAKIGIKMHEILTSPRATAYIEILFKDQLKFKKLKLIAPEKAAKIPLAPEVDMFLHQFFREKNRIMLEDFIKES